MGQAGRQAKGHQGSASFLRVLVTSDSQSDDLGLTCQLCNSCIAVCDWCWVWWLVRDLCSLVPQEDVLLSSFTVRETLMFSAHLRLPTTKTLAQKTDIVNEVRGALSISISSLTGWLNGR